MQGSSPNSLLQSPGSLDLLRPEGGEEGARGAKPGLSIALPAAGQPFTSTMVSPGLIAMADAAEASNEAATALGALRLTTTSFLVVDANHPCWPLSRDIRVENQLSRDG